MANSASLKDELELAVGDALNSSIGLTGGNGTDDNSVGPGGLGGGGSRNLDGTPTNHDDNNLVGAEDEDEPTVQPTGRFNASNAHLDAVVNNTIND